ncbi:MAG TPA: ParB N-terminal domain-containing protein [Aggregatilineaceae bacterium]|nr:ParB N-terminal domain-containing protein [Aggregatilineaceae bacterium]
MTKRRSRGTRALLEEMGDLGSLAETTAEIAGGSIKVVSIVLDRIRPDPAQPRRVLPDSIRKEFLAGHINPRQALERWEAMVAEEAARLGRPRPDWQALLERNPEDRAEDMMVVDAPGQPGPEEEALRSIVATAATILHGGQVSPITVSEIDNGSYYRIETGERRYWAHHWLNMWLPNGFDQIHCLVVDHASPWRQAAENASREELSAMALARQVATLLLDLYDIHPDYSMSIPNEWYRQALDYRVPRGEGTALRAALGGIERSQFNRLQALLALPDSVWELADRHRLEEKRLRYVLKVQDEALQVQLVHMIVDRNLSAERVQRLVESGELTSLFAGYDWAADRYSDEDILSERVANRWFSLARQVPQADLMVVANEWLRRQTPEEVRQQVAALRRLLEIVERRVQD